MKAMAEVPLTERYNIYINDQVDRIEAFQEQYESQNDVALGAYPYAVDGEIITPASLYADTEEYSKHRIVENEIHTQLIMEAQYQNSIESVDGLESYRTLQSLDTATFSSLSDNLVIDGHVDNLTEANELTSTVLSDLEGSDNPTLSKVKELSNGKNLSPSSEENKVNELLQSMESHYESHPRPSQQMEELIQQAEQEARQLDNTLDRILTLEEQGVENPLAAPDVETPEVSTESERELLKSLYRNKQQSHLSSSSTPKSPSKSQGLDI